MSTAFSSLLSSIGKPSQTASSQPSTSTSGASKSTPAVPNAAKPPAVTNGASRPTPNDAVAGVKRKAEEQAAGPQAKVVRTEVKVPVPPSGQINGQPAAAKPVSASVKPVSAKPVPASANPAGPYRGTLKAPGSSNTGNPTSKSAPAPARPAAAAASANGAAPAKRGFAAMMEKAKAAQAAAKGAGLSTIKHKPVEKMTKKERQKMQEGAKAKPGPNGERAKANDRSRSGTPMDGKLGLSKKGAEPSYKGTMKKKPVPPPVAYKGTMKKAEPGAPPSKPAAKKGLPQDRFGGYADWDELDDAPEEEEEDYDSYESDDMEAGFDDVAGEEELALKSARREDQEALAEEERHRREKEERRRRLAALNKSAAAKKKY